MQTFTYEVFLKRLLRTRAWVYLFSILVESSKLNKSANSSVLELDVVFLSAHEIRKVIQLITKSPFTVTS